MHKDKALVGSGSAVRMFSKKGKELLKIQTTMTSETISNIALSIPNLWVAGDYVLYRYYESEEKAFFMSPDKINSMVHANTNSGITVILGCQDRVFRVVDDSRLVLEFPASGPITAMTTYKAQNVDITEPSTQ